MNEEALANLTDEELLIEAKKMKSNPIINAVFIGLMIGIIIYSIKKNGFGLLALILLFIVYKLINNSKKDKALEKLLNERNLN